MAYVMKDRNGTFYLRIVLGEGNRQRLGKGEYRRSLGTKSKREADRRLPEAYMKAMELIDTSRAPGTPIKAPSKPQLSTLLEKHSKHQELTGVLPGTIYKRTYAVNLLLRFVKDKPIDHYTKEDARIFRDKVLEIPKKGHKGKTVSITTFNNYASQIISFFIWCEKEGYVDTNVFNGIKIQQKRLQSSYRNIFLPEDLKKIFNSIENTTGIIAPRYWIPYISYYTGCRVSEACTLSKDDIYKVDGVWCIHFRETKDYQRLKNGYSERFIPVHSELIRLGFIEYCNTCEDRIFPTTKTPQISQWFGKLLKKLDIGPNKTFHSFRHTASNTLKQHGTDVSLTAALLGHSTNTISYDRYGKSLKPSILVDVVEKITPVNKL
ncbi:MAG: tyrosine-type recombinase/integrase [Pseudomonadota bacterium]